MYSEPTTYRSGSRVVEVLPGESHSAAWAYVTAGGPRPVTYPCVGRVRRRVHGLARRTQRRRPLVRVA
jgi:hypothetical protein